MSFRDVEGSLYDLGIELRSGNFRCLCGPLSVVGTVLFTELLVIIVRHNKDAPRLSGQVTTLSRLCASNVANKKGRTVLRFLLCQAALLCT